MEVSILLNYAISLIAGMTGVLLVGIFYMLYTKKPILQIEMNDFSVPLGRKKEITRLADYISTGQSSAVVGIFDEERTEILNVLRDRQQLHLLYGKRAGSFIFSYVDISTFKDDVTPQDFWERVLMPLSEIEIEFISNLHQKCVEGGYQEYYLRRLFEQLRSENFRFILLIDKFNLLQSKQNFKTDFFATLRSLSSSSTTHAFVIVLTMGITTNQFIQLEMGRGVTGSSLVSHVDAHEIILASIEDNELLEFMKTRKIFASFDDKTLQEIVSLTGGYPYLLRFVENYLQQYGEEQLNQQDNIVKSLEKELKDRLQFILKGDFVKDGKLTTLESVINLDFQEAPTIQKELERLGLLKEGKPLAVLKSVDSE